MWEQKKNFDALGHYLKIGWLDFMASRWKGIDRLAAGERWQRDFHNAGFDVRTIDPSKPRVDCQGFRQPSDKRERAENSFRRATRTLPRDFYPTVHKVCLENKTFKGTQEERYAVKKDLVRGLDYLCDYYFKRQILS